MKSLTRGHYQGFAAYLIWGLFPIYWKHLSHISTFEILFHRIIWSFVFLGLLLRFWKRKNSPQSSPHQSAQQSLWLSFRSQSLSVILLSILIVSNWVIYVYAVNVGQILQGSLAYFMTPLLNIALGAWLFKEKLSTRMKIATGIAASGVLLLAVISSGFPWIALSLALTFGIYGVLKKKVQLGGLESSFLENAVMFPLALIAVLAPPAVFASVVPGAELPLLTNLTSLDWVLLSGGGIVTATPILLFSLAARQIPFNHLGILQFLAPTLQFIIGFFMYKEVVSPARLAAFFCVWVGVALYLHEIFRQHKRGFLISQK